MTDLGPGPWTVQHVYVLTREQVLAVLAAMPGDGLVIGRVFADWSWETRDRLRDRACALLKAAGLAHYDRAARVWRRIETQEKTCPT